MEQQRRVAAAGGFRRTHTFTRIKKVVRGRNNSHHTPNGNCGSRGSMREREWKGVATTLP